MGYQLSSIATLPLRENTKMYVFIAAEGFAGPVEDMLRANFEKLGRDFGSDGVLLRGYDGHSWSVEVLSRYFGDPKPYQSMMPGLLITDSHPDRLTKDSMKIFISLTEVARKMDTGQFFWHLVEFVRGESDELLKWIEPVADPMDVLNQVFTFRPSIMGFGVNFNEIFKIIVEARKKKPEGTTRPGT